MNASIAMSVNLYVQMSHFMGDVIYEIHPDLCTECVGHFDEPQCQLFCPVDCIPKDPDHVETHGELLQKYQKLIDQKSTSN
jgi:ferredoxin